ncbi:UNVERIFIED_CONTAM: hypothetical protein NCL1_45822 [Trichonephila clavipes]
MKFFFTTLNIYLSNTCAWLLDHLMPSLPVPTDNIVSRVFIEFSALEQVVAIHSGMAIEWAGHMSSQVKPVEVYSQKVISCGLAKAPQLSPGASGLDPQWPEFPMAFQGSWSFGS